jgi:putative ABC transport system permease protein
MSLFGLSLAYIRARSLNAALNLLLLGLGIGTIVLLILFSARLEERLTRDARDIDLVVGAKGSPLQLILSSVYQADIPTGNIPLAEAERWRQHPLVESAIPLAMGDNVAGFRIVGTEHGYPEHYGASLAAGRLWEAPFEATLGARVAADTGLTVGDRFVGSHGLGGGAEHAAHPYTVVGVLTPSASVLDRLVLTPIASVWEVHGMTHEEHEASEEHDDHAAHEEHDEHATEHAGSAAAAADPQARPLEITSLLLRYRSPLGAVQLPRLVNQESALQAASPALESARLLSLIGIGLDTVRAFGLLLVASAGLGVLIALSSAMQERRYDLAVMRTLGASRRTLFAQPLLEGLILAAAGALLGLLLGHGVAELLGRLLPAARDMGLTGLRWRPEELYVVLLALGVGLLAALIPAIQAYRTDIAATLASRA